MKTIPVFLSLIILFFIHGCAQDTEEPMTTRIELEGTSISTLAVGKGITIVAPLSVYRGKQSAFIHALAHNHQLILPQFKLGAKLRENMHELLNYYQDKQIKLLLTPDELKTLVDHDLSDDLSSFAIIVNAINGSVRSVSTWVMLHTKPVQLILSSHTDLSIITPNSASINITMMMDCQLKAMNCYTKLPLLTSTPTTRKNAVTTGSTFSDPLQSGNPGPEVIVIPNGYFLFGKKNNQHPEYIVRPLAVMVNEVRVADFQLFIDQTNHSVNKTCWHHTLDQIWLEEDNYSWKNPGFEQDNNHPVTCIVYADAMAYADWLSNQTGYHYRLPTEIEFEFYNRAGRPINISRDYCNEVNGADLSTGLHYANRCYDGYSYTAPVRQFPANAFGLHETSGNLWELTLNCWPISYLSQFKNFLFDKKEKYLIGDCHYHTKRGGSWLSSTKNLKFTKRKRDSEPKGLHTTGMRLVREL